MSNQFCAPLEAFIMLGLQFCRMLKGVYFPCSKSALLWGIQLGGWLCLFWFPPLPSILATVFRSPFLALFILNFVGQISAFCLLWEVCAFSWPQIIILPFEVCSPKCLHQVPVLLYFPVFCLLPLPSVTLQAVRDHSPPVSLILCMVTSWFMLICGIQAV